MKTADHIKIPDNIQIRLGDDGATDAYIEFNGTNLRFFDSAVSGGVKTLSQLVAASNPGIDDVYNNGARTVTVDAGDIVLNLTDATNDYKLKIDNTSTGTINDALIINSSGAGSVLTDAIDVSDAAIVNAINVGANTIVGTTAIIDFTNFDVAANGDTTIGGTLSITGAFSSNALAAATAGTTLTLDGKTTGGVNIGSTSTGGVTLGANTTLASGKTLTITGTEDSNIVTVTAGDVVVTLGSITITDNDNAAGIVFTNNTITTASMMTLDSTSLTTGKGLAITANAITSGAMVYLETSAAGFTGKYVQLYNGTADDFSVKTNGLTTLKGSAAGTDVLVLDAGDLQITSGNIDVDAGKLEVDTATDQTSYFKRNQGVTTGPVVEIEATHTGDDQPCLLVDQNATGAIDALQITIDGAGNGALVTAAAAGTTGYNFTAAASATGRAYYSNLGAWLGTAGQGAIELVSNSATTIPAGQMMRLNQQGTGTHASAIEGSVFFAKDAATAPGAGTSYLMTLEATNIEALHVDVGRSVFDEGIDIPAVGTLKLGTTFTATAGAATNLNITGNMSIGDGGTTNYLRFDANTGAITAFGSARPTRSDFVGAGAFVAHTGSAALTQVGTGLAFGWALDAAADESVTAFWQVPRDWDAATNVTAKIHWVANATTGDAVFDLTTLGIISGETVNAAGNADSTTQTTAGTAWFLNITSALTIAFGELAAGDMLAVKINRDADNAADTLSVDAFILGVEFSYTKAYL